jgi:hypothetical protein
MSADIFRATSCNLHLAERNIARCTVSKLEQECHSSVMSNSHLEPVYDDETYVVSDTLDVNSHSIFVRPSEYKYLTHEPTDNSESFAV